MSRWLRFEPSGLAGIGTHAGGIVTIHSGDLFAGATPTGQTGSLSDARLTPL